MEWLWQFFYTLLPPKYPPMALSTLKTFLGGNSSDTLFFFLYLEIFGWEQLKKSTLYSGMELFRMRRVELQFYHAYGGVGWV